MTQLINLLKKNVLVSSKSETKLFVRNKANAVGQDNYFQKQTFLMKLLRDSANIFRYFLNVYFLVIIADQNSPKAFYSKKHVVSFRQ